MKTKLSFFALLVLITNSAYASCGSLPQSPSLLNESQVTDTQFYQLEGEMNGYSDDIDAYQNCISQQASALVPENATEEFFNDVNYRNQHESLMNAISLSETHRATAIERYNQLLATPRLPE